MKMVFMYLKVIFFSIFIFWMGSCAPKKVVLTRSRLMMGHVPVNIILRTTSDSKSKAIEASERAYKVAQDIEKKISEYQPNSEVSCLNRNAGKRFCEISKETYEILNQSIQMTKDTDAAFDIRFASLSKMGREAAIVLRSGKAFLKHPDTRIGLSSIGKGFILNAMIQSFKKEGFDQVLIDGGGDIQSSGGPWKVAIQTPGKNPDKISKSFEIYDQALATSGNYEQAANVRDPRTLEKVVRSSSVSIVAPSLTLANALTTAFYVMGEKTSISYFSKFPGIEIFWVDADGTIRTYSTLIK